MTGKAFVSFTKLALGVVTALSLLVALPSVSHAQRMTAELNGTVVDESGAAAPGADVTLTNESSRAVRRSVTNASGFFAFSAVPAGNYKLLVALQGFQSFEVTGVALGAGDSRTLREMKLKVAAMAETVSVTSDVQLTPLNSGERSTTLTAEVFENIPIVSSSAAELLRVLPGMTPQTQGTTNRPNFTGEVIGINGNGEFSGGGGNNQSAIGNFSANGTRTSSLDITIDGAPGADPGCNCATSVNPNTEMVQEFKVLSSSFSAEYAKGPNSMTVVTKSGGRDFHGSAFMYFRDYHLNSNEWFANKIDRDRVENKFVYPGFTISGPLSFGGFNKNKDKIFFFAGYEYYKQSLDTGFVRSWVPTAEMRNGDFSNAAAVGSGGYVNGVPNFPGGVVPGNLMDPGGRALLNLFPMPNADPGQTGGWNYVNNLLVDQPNHQFLARIDFNLSDSTKAFVRYNLQRETQPFVIGLWWRNGQRQLPYPSAVTAPNRSDSITASLTHVFSPTLTSETVVAFTYIDFPNQFADRNAISRQALGYPYQGVFGESNDQIPSVDPGGWGDNGPLIYNPGGFDPVLFATKWQWAFTENLTKVWGTHTAKFGVFWEQIRNNQPGNLDSNGQMFFGNWNSNSTGNTFADLLTGQITGEYAETEQNILHDIIWNRWEAYAQDSWKLSPSFTLNVGARFSMFEPWKDNQGNGFATWYPDRYAADLAAGRSNPGVYWNAIDSSVPLSGVDTSFYFQPRVGFAWDVRGNGETVLRGGTGVYLWHDPQGVWAGLVDLPNGVRRYYQGGGNFTIKSLEGLGTGSILGGGNTIDNADDKQPRTYTWSLTVNQKLPWSMNAELGYVGNKQVDQNNDGVANFNAVPLGAMSGCFPACQDDNAFRPLSAYGDLQVYRHDITTNYHGFQALVARQRGRYNFTAAYTFSKTLGIRSGRGPSLGSEYILTPYENYNYGVGNDDRTHVATGSFSYLLPDPKSEGALKHILGGWQVAGILSYVSGAPLPYANNNVNFSVQGTNELGESINPRMYSGSPQVPVMPVLTCDPTDNIPNGYMFNPSCFALPQKGTNGNYNMPYMKAQPFWNVDLSLFKNFDLGGSRKLQLRFNAYNALNHPIAAPDDGTNLTLRFANGVQTDPKFGRLPTEDDATLGGANKFGRRIVQLAVRFTF
jgi:Carboxypeptidase regulatory-like domain